MIIHVLNGFYEKSEVEFLGEEINFKFMTSAQLDNEIVKSIKLYNELYPPYDGWMNTAGKLVKVAVIGGAVAISAGGVLAAYGVSLPVAFTAATGQAATAATASSAAFSTIASGASYVSGAGLVYSAVTGKTPPEKLMAAADLINSPTATNAMEKLAKREMERQGVKLQDKDKKSNEALRERIKKEQQKMSDKLRQSAVIESENSGLPMPEKRKVSKLELAAVATPFLLYFLG